MQNPSEPRERRSQRDYSLPFKLAAGPTSPGTAPAVDLTPEQRTEQLDATLRE